MTPMKLKLKTLDPLPPAEETGSFEQFEVPATGDRRIQVVGERLLSIDASEDPDDGIEAPTFSLDLFATPTESVFVLVTRQNGDGAPVAIAAVEADTLPAIHAQLYAIDPADSEPLNLGPGTGRLFENEQAMLLDFAARRARARRIYGALIDAALAPLEA
jgi:hypothetical protein